MYRTDWQFGKIAGNDASVGTVSFSNPQNVLFDNPGVTPGSYASYGFIDPDLRTVRAKTAKLIIDDVITGTNTATEELFASYTSTLRTIGANNNLWGTTITPRDIKRSNFGVALQLGNKNISGGTYQLQSRYIIVKGFRFSIPKESVITGIETEVRAGTEYSGPGVERTTLYTIRMRVHYTYSPVLTLSGSTTGHIVIDEQEDPEISQVKSYQYLAFERNKFMGEWKDVVSIPRILIGINELPGELNITLARTIDSTETDFDAIILSGYNTELITTQDDEEILAAIESTYGIGEGTDLEVDHSVKVKEFYGGYESLLTSDGQELITSQGEPLEVPSGYPRGRMYYRGYVSDYGLAYEVENQSTEVKLLHLSDELNNEIYKTPDVLKTDNYGNPLTALSYGFGGWVKPDEGVIDEFGFTITPSTSYLLKRLVLPMIGWKDNIVTLTIRSGSTIGSGTVLAIGTATITNEPDINVMSFNLPEALSVVSATIYNVVLTSEFSRETLAQQYPASIKVGPDYAGGSSAIKMNNVWVPITEDVAFQLWQEGGNTRVSELSIDPSDIQKKVLDYNKLTGGLITYDQSSIVDTDTEVSAPFNANTLKDAGDYVLKLAPSNWFYYVDPGELLWNLKPRPEEISHYFTLKKDIIRANLHKNIEQLANYLMFTGGGDPALFRDYTDVASRAKWRKGLFQFTDNRVTDNDTADIILEAKANEVSQPIWLGTVEILRSEHPTMIYPGQLAGFRNFGNIIELLAIQITSVDVMHDRYIVQVGTQPPKQSKRIEDIKRNLTRLEIENNPNNPS